MLEELHIRGLGVIEETALPLGPGLTVVTGETGAGKTMVVTALLLLFGGRADTARVRAGVAQATVDGRVLLPPGSSVEGRVTDAGGELDADGGLTLRRAVGGGAGRSRAYVGGAPAPVGLLTQLADQLLTVHGQADQLRLGRPAEQRAALDRFASVDTAGYGAAYMHWRQAASRLADRTSRARELRREFDLLQHGLSEIEAVDPQPGEDAELAVAASRLAHADALRLAARAAHDALLGDPDDLSDEPDATSLLGRAQRALESQAEADPQLAELAARLADLTATAVDLGGELSAYSERIDADPGRLAELESRRAALSTLTRKYADERTGTGGIDGVLAWADDTRSRLAELDVSDDALSALAAVRDAAAARVAQLAGSLSAARAKAAVDLAEQVTVELAGLAMPGARLQIAVRPRPVSAAVPSLHVDGHEVGVGPDGVDDVEILLQPHADAPALPLARGASGGELARVMLAVEVCLAGSDPVPTMVFDEIDAGVGGRAAVEVGRRLARLATDRQVLVVTHLAQVAASADRHVVIDKTGDSGVTRSDVRVVDGADRVAELARMLAGSDSDTAREHAAELLASVRRERVHEPSHRNRRTSRTNPRKAAP